MECSTGCRRSDQSAAQWPEDDNSDHVVNIRAVRWIGEQNCVQLICGQPGMYCNGENVDHIFCMRPQEVRTQNSPGIFTRSGPSIPSSPRRCALMKPNLMYRGLRF